MILETVVLTFAYCTVLCSFVLFVCYVCWMTEFLDLRNDMCACITKTDGAEEYWWKTVNACEIIIYVNYRTHIRMCEDFV